MYLASTLPRFLVVCVLCVLYVAAQAQQKLKWAHVYEASEPYHTESVWAAEEIKKRSNGKFNIQVFPASSLGKETDLNQGLMLGSVDIMIGGPSFAARTYPRFGIAYYPFIFRDGDHLLAYAKSSLFQEMVNEFRQKTGIQVTAYTYYGARHTTANKAFKQCADVKGLKIRVPDAPAYTANNLDTCTGYLGFHSRAIFCASAICAEVASAPVVGGIASIVGTRDAGRQ